MSKDEFISTMWTLIRAAREGDPAALEDFVLRYRSPIVAFCARRGLASDAEDIAQEVLVRLFHDGILLRAEPAHGRFRSLVLAVTRHVLGDHLRRARAEKRGSGRIEPMGDRDIAAPVDDLEFDREWVAHLLQRALDRLAGSHPAYHETLRLFLLDGRAYAEVAQELHCSEGDVKNRVHRGKRKLIEYLREQVREYSTSKADYEEELRALSRLLPSEPPDEA